MKDRFTILKKPILTEKTYLQGEVYNTYSFVVEKRATKTQIKNDIEKLFNVKVKKVRTMKAPDRKKRMGKFVGIIKGQKKALVTLFPEYNLNFFGETTIDEKEEKKKKKEAKKEESETKKSKKKETKEVSKKTKTTKKTDDSKKETKKKETKKSVKKSKTTKKTDDKKKETKESGVKKTTTKVKKTKSKIVTKTKGDEDGN